MKKEIIWTKWERINDTTNLVPVMFAKKLVGNIHVQTDHIQVFGKQLLPAHNGKFGKQNKGGDLTYYKNIRAVTAEYMIWVKLKNVDGFLKSTFKNL